MLCHLVWLKGALKYISETVLGYSLLWCKQLGEHFWEVMCFVFMLDLYFNKLSANRTSDWCKYEEIKILEIKLASELKSAYAHFFPYTQTLGSWSSKILNCLLNSTVEKWMSMVQKYEFLPLLSSMLFAVSRVKASISELCQEPWSVIAWPSIDLALRKLLYPGDKSVERLNKLLLKMLSLSSCNSGTTL